jgi:hypothetical protein
MAGHLAQAENALRVAYVVGFLMLETFMVPPGYNHFTLLWVKVGGGPLNLTRPTMFIVP